eukprot:659722-Pleurochrysis_carterae.AAC.2
MTYNPPICLGAVLYDVPLTSASSPLRSRLSFSRQRRHHLPPAVAVPDRRIKPLPPHVGSRHSHCAALH